MRFTGPVTLVALVFATSLAHAQGGPLLRDCESSQLTLTVDASHDSDFDGMSHAGTTLVLTNTGDRACTLLPFLPVTLLDAGNRKLDAIGKPPGAKFMHPGPVVPPAVLHPGDHATASIRWVDDEVFQYSYCVDPTRLAVAIGGKNLTVAFSAHLCGEASQPILYDLSRFSAPSAAQ